MKNNRSKKSLTPEKIEKREKAAFKTKIRNIFVGTGFQYIPTGGHNIFIGNREEEIDSMFIYENIWILCEDTIKTTDIRDHIRTKNEAFGEIKTNISSLKEILIELFPERKEFINKYEPERIKPFCLYISKNELSLSKQDYDLYNNLIFVEPQTLNYFQWVVKGLHFSARNEIFRFLKIKLKDIGLPKSSGSISEITAPIIYPKEFTGLTNKVRIVSFMMSAGDLLNTGYVLRKDNWENSIWLYQRLIDNNRLKKVRCFIEEKGEAFYNNIIVALPDTVSFKNSAGEPTTLDKINELDGNYQLIIPKELNSICIIDGQHRIFAHYDSGTFSKQEKIISDLRKKLHLLVTGLFFPKEMSMEKRLKIQSEIFNDINSNAKSVPANILLQIKRIMNPIADESIAQFVVEKLNKQDPFMGMLQLSSFEHGKIKTASIVRFALRYTVTITPATGKKSLFDYWSGDKNALKHQEESALTDYINYCVSIFSQYFKAVKKKFKDYWNNESKLLTVTALNGFIIALTRQLEINGVKDFAFYDNIFSKWDFDFSKENFNYTSSQYRKFSTEILCSAFKISREIVEKL